MKCIALMVLVFAFTESGAATEIWNQPLLYARETARAIEMLKQTIYERAKIIENQTFPTCSWNVDDNLCDIDSSFATQFVGAVGSTAAVEKVAAYATCAAVPINHTAQCSETPNCENNRVGRCTLQWNDSMSVGCPGISADIPAVFQALVMKQVKCSGKTINDCEEAKDCIFRSASSACELDVSGIMMNLFFGRISGQNITGRGDDNMPEASPYQQAMWLSIRCASKNSSTCGTGPECEWVYETCVANQSIIISLMYCGRRHGTDMSLPSNGTIRASGCGPPQEFQEFVTLSEWSLECAQHSYDMCPPELCQINETACVLNTTLGTRLGMLDLEYSDSLAAIEFKCISLDSEVACNNSQNCVWEDHYCFIRSEIGEELIASYASDCTSKQNCVWSSAGCISNHASEISLHACGELEPQTLMMSALFNSSRISAACSLLYSRALCSGNPDCDFVKDACILSELRQNYPPFAEMIGPIDQLLPLHSKCRGLSPADCGLDRDCVFSHNTMLCGFNLDLYVVNRIVLGSGNTGALVGGMVGCSRGSSDCYDCNTDYYHSDYWEYFYDNYSNHSDHGDYVYSDYNSSDYHHCNYSDYDCCNVSDYYYRNDFNTTDHVDYNYCNYSDCDICNSSDWSYWSYADYSYWFYSNYSYWTYSDSFKQSYYADYVDDDYHHYDHAEKYAQYLDFVAVSELVEIINTCSSMKSMSACSTFQYSRYLNFSGSIETTSTTTAVETTATSTSTTVAMVTTEGTTIAATSTSESMATSSTTTVAVITTTDGATIAATTTSKSMVTTTTTTMAIITTATFGVTDFADFSPTLYFEILTKAVGANSKGNVDSVKYIAKVGYDVSGIISQEIAKKSLAIATVSNEADIFVTVGRRLSQQIRRLATTAIAARITSSTADAANSFATKASDVGALQGALAANGVSDAVANVTAAPTKSILVVTTLTSSSAITAPTFEQISIPLGSSVTVQSLSSKLIVGTGKETDVSGAEVKRTLFLIVTVLVSALLF